jgi:ubiquinone/menaquinone biosynthesis C-methylase UbiE
MTKRTFKEDKLAKIYDAEILPIWGRRFGRMLLRDLTLPHKAMVLDVGCGTGYPSLEILRRMDDQGRIIAIDSSSPLLDEARTKAGKLSGRRIFFRSESALPKLPFADEVYDLVVSNAGLAEFDDPEVAIRDFQRVTKDGGRVAVSLPLAGTFGEFFDILREVLTKQDRPEAIDRLDAHLVRYPPLEQAEAWFEDAGLSEVRSEHEVFTLLFKSSREFFFAPIIEYGPLAGWKVIAGKGQAMQDVFWHCKQAIDAYFAGSSFAVTVVAGCITGRKLGAPARSWGLSPRAPAEQAGDTAQSDLDEEAPTGEVELVTGEIEIVESVTKRPGGRPAQRKGGAGPEAPGHGEAEGAASSDGIAEERDGIAGPDDEDEEDAELDRF